MQFRAIIIGLLCSIVALTSFLLKQGSIATIAGTGMAGTSDGQALFAKLNNPFGVVRGPDGALWFCEYDGHTVRRIDEKGNVTTLVGNGMAAYAGDGGSPLQASLHRPHEIRFDTRGDLFIADMSNHVIRKVDFIAGKISTIAGTGVSGFSGDGGPADQAQLNQPHSIQFGPDGSLYIADVGNNRVRVIEAHTGQIRTFVGNGETGPTPDNAPIKHIPLNGPRSIDFDQQGDLWLVLRNANQVCRIDMRAEMIHHIAGNGTKGFSGNGGDARLASLSGPKGITIAPNGLVYIADTESHSIRRIDRNSGTIDLVVGTGTKFDGADGDPLKCGLARPHGVFAEVDGSILIGDSENHKIRIYRP